MKCFQYLNGTTGRVFTEDQIRAHLAEHPNDLPIVDAVLALEIGAKYTSPRGTVWERLQDDSPLVGVIICGIRRTPAKRCNYRFKPESPPCGIAAPYLCDFPKTGSATCDAPRCRRHCIRTGPDRDVCIEHPRGDGHQKTLL